MIWKLMGSLSFTAKPTGESLCLQKVGIWKYLRSQGSSIGTHSLDELTRLKKDIDDCTNFFTHVSFKKNTTKILYMRGSMPVDVKVNEMFIPILYNSPTVFVVYTTIYILTTGSSSVTIFHLIVV